MNTAARFLTLTVTNTVMLHGYDEDNREITEEIPGAPVEKIVALERIQSVTEKFVLVTSSHGRMMYWEYLDGYENLKARLKLAGLLLE